jgi:hypothetical protein
VSHTVLGQARLTTNLLTRNQGIAYLTNQVHVPLGLVERKRQSKRQGDVSPDKGSSLYQETEITQTLEHEAFLEQVLKVKVNELLLSENQERAKQRCYNKSLNGHSTKLRR